jgi:hypothetical protein
LVLAECSWLRDFHRIVDRMREIGHFRDFPVYKQYHRVASIKRLIFASSRMINHNSVDIMIDAKNIS